MRSFLHAITAAAVFLMLVSPCSVFSDEAIEARKLTVGPKTGSSVAQYSKKASKAGRWVEINLDFTSKVQWIEEMTVKFYALVSSPKGGDILYGDITYLNVPAGKGNSATLFVHPTTMMKYGKIDAVHCEIWAKGELRDVADFPSKPQKKWWDMKPSLKGLLVNKFYTPFTLDAEYDGLAIKTSN